jgi:hypothetical protein
MHRQTINRGARLRKFLHRRENFAVGIQKKVGGFAVCAGQTETIDAGE